MDNTDVIARIEGLRIAADEASDRLEKAMKRPGKRLPGDGDGDGIPNEGKGKKGGVAGGKMTPVKTQNEGMGYHGAAMAALRVKHHGVDGQAKTEGDWKRLYDGANEAFTRAANKLVQAGHFSDVKAAGKFLDSRHGRHLGDQIGHNGDPTSVKWLPKAIGEYHRAAVRGG